MSLERELSLIAATPAPRTRAGLVRDLRDLGVTPGKTLFVHASLSAIGWTAGGAAAVVGALLEVLGPGGTLAMPAFSDRMGDPASWIDPPLPEDWVDLVRAALPAFDPDITPSDMGQISETFRTWPGVLRSRHPQVSVCARGRHAEAIVAEHPLPWACGPEGPFGRLYDLDARILLLGVGYNRNSALHFAETRAAHRRLKQRRIAIDIDGRRSWREFPDVADDLGRFFPDIGRDFEAEQEVQIGRVGSAESRLMSLRTLADFATPWLDARLAAGAGGPA